MFSPSFLSYYEDFKQVLTDKLICNATITENEDATTVINEATDTPDPCKNSKKILKDSTTTENKNTAFIEDKNSEDLQLICENSRAAKETSDIVLAKTTVREPTFKPCLDSTDKSPSTREKQAILAGGAGIVLLIGSIASYVLKVPIIGVIGGIVGLACMGFALYNLLKPNTKLENLKSIEQPTHTPLGAT